MLQTEVLILVLFELNKIIVISLFLGFTRTLFSEWRHGRGGHLTLQDEDLTTKSVCGWRKLNTLAHYGVKESAVMSLIPRQNTNCKQPCHNCKLFLLSSFNIFPLSDNSFSNYTNYYAVNK